MYIPSKLPSSRSGRRITPKAGKSPERKTSGGKTERSKKEEKPPLKKPTTRADKPEKLFELDDLVPAKGKGKGKGKGKNKPKPAEEEISDDGFQCKKGQKLIPLEIEEAKNLSMKGFFERRRICGGTHYTQEEYEFYNNLKDEFKEENEERKKKGDDALLFGEFVEINKVPRVSSPKRYVSRTKGELKFYLDKENQARVDAYKAKLNLSSYKKELRKEKEKQDLMFKMKHYKDRQFFTAAEKKAFELYYDQYHVLRREKENARKRKDPTEKEATAAGRAALRDLSDDVRFKRPPVDPPADGGRSRRGSAGMLYRSGVERYFNAQLAFKNGLYDIYNGKMYPHWNYEKQRYEGPPVDIDYKVLRYWEKPNDPTLGNIKKPEQLDKDWFFEQFKNRMPQYRLQMNWDRFPDLAVGGLADLPESSEDGTSTTGSEDTSDNTDDETLMYDFNNAMKRLNFTRTKNPYKKRGKKAQKKKK